MKQVKQASALACFIKIQIGLTFLVLAYPGCPGIRAIKWVSVCLFTLILSWFTFYYQ